MNPIIDVKEGDSLTEEEIKVMNHARKNEFGKNETKEFRKDYPLKTIYLFLKVDKKIKAFGILQPIKINYHKKEYNIYGISSIISIEKLKGYGKKILSEIINQLKKEEKTGLGFCEPNTTIFYKRSGLSTKKDFIKRFHYRNLKNGKVDIDNVGDGIFISGKDHFIQNVLDSKGIVYIPIPHW